MFSCRHLTARSPLPAAGVLLLVVAFVCATSVGTVGAATSTSVVGATVPSATSIDASACAPDTPDVTSLGTVTAGATVITPLDCVVTFGSSNDTARLRVAQHDAVGDAMFMPLGGFGALDPVFAAGAGSLAVAGLTVDDASTSGSPGGIARQSDGRILVAGENGATIEVRRLLPDGSPDATFSTVSLTVCATQDVGGIVLTTDGGFVVGGETDGTCPGIGAWAAKFAANGTRDMTYGGDGLAESGFVSDIRDVDVHADGSVILAGGNTVHELIRLTPAGAPDLAFDGDGRLVMSAIGTGATRGAQFLADGSVVAFGLMDSGSGNRPYVARVTPTGSFDGTFGGGDGWEPAVSSIISQGRAGTVAPDGSIYVASYRLLSKFTPAGVPDATFGTNGTVDLQAIDPLIRLHDVILQPDGDVVGVGRYNAEFAMLVRLDATGTLDTSFGNGGVQTIDAPGTSNGANRVTWTEDGDLLTIGAGASGATVVRFDGLTVSDYGAGSDWTTPGTNAFGACLGSVASGASALLATDGSCDAADGTDWYEITPAALPVARTTVSTTQGAAARLRFGLRTTSTQRAGTYIAPIIFSVVAPDA